MVPRGLRWLLALSIVKQHAALCTNTCKYSGDAECDDGGSGASYRYPDCTLGTDCDDCGTRGVETSAPTTPFCKISEAAGNPCTTSDYCCDCACTYCGPKEYCDAHSPFKTNCNKCDPTVRMPIGVKICANYFSTTCSTGVSSTLSSSTIQPTAFPTRHPTKFPTSATCSNSCRYQYDGYCDDGGVGSSYSDCAYGTDCSDCGYRTARPTGKIAAL